MAKGEKNGNWRGGVAEYPDHYLMKKIRLEVLEEANYTCQICGGKATEIHHIDKTKKNHTKENFLAVCRKCHRREFHPPPTLGKHWTWTDEAKIKLSEQKQSSRFLLKNLRP